VVFGEVTPGTLTPADALIEYRPAGVSGDTLRVTSFDPATGAIEGYFQFTGRDGSRPDRAEDIVVTEGYFRTTATLTRWGSAPARSR